MKRGFFEGIFQRKIHHGLDDWVAGVFDEIDLFDFYVGKGRRRDLSFVVMGFRGWWGFLDCQLLRQSRVQIKRIERILRNLYLRTLLSPLAHVRATPTVLAPLTLTQLRTGNPCLVALTVLLQTERFLAVTALRMAHLVWIHHLAARLSNQVDLGFEGIGVSLKNLVHGFSSGSRFTAVVAAAAVTELVAGKTGGEAVTVELETFGLFAVAADSTCWLRSITRENLHVILCLIWRRIAVFILFSCEFLWNFRRFVFLFLLFLGLWFFNNDRNLYHIWVWLWSLHLRLRKSLNLRESFVKESLLSNLNCLLVSIKIEKLVKVHWLFIMTIWTLKDLLLHIFHVSFIHLMVSFQEWRRIILKLMIILLWWFWAKSKYLILLIEVSTKIMKWKPSLRRLRIQIKINTIELWRKRRVMISDSSILASWAFHHRRIVSLKFVLRQIFGNWRMEYESLINVRMRSVFLKRVAPAWEFHWRAILAIILAIATTNRVAAGGRHPLDRSNLHIRLILRMSNSGPHLVRAPWSPWREVMGRLPQHPHERSPHLFWSEIVCALPQWL